MPETEHLNRFARFIDAIYDSIGPMDDFAQAGISPFRHDAAKHWLFPQQLQFFDESGTEPFGGGRIVAGDETDEGGQIIVGDFRYADLESHV